MKKVPINLINSTTAATYIQVVSIKCDTFSPSYLRPLMLQFFGLYGHREEVLLFVLCMKIFQSDKRFLRNFPHYFEIKSCSSDILDVIQTRIICKLKKI
jgi:hypothetical protein